MTLPREQLIAVEDTPYYHVTSRCVRRAFLCGHDYETGKTYEHRKLWIEQRIRLLSSIFAIDICSYAVMSNHYHVVVKLCPTDATKWTDNEVLQRWTHLHKGPALVQKYLNGDTLTPEEKTVVSTCISLYRERLSDLGWYMKCLNEPIAKQANLEDKYTGHFFEARYKSQALLTEEALLTCMAYVDLNPIRAKMAKTPEQSDYTSIKERIAPSLDLEQAIKEQTQQGVLQAFELPLKPLMHFEGNEKNHEQLGIIFGLEEYLTLVDSTGRIVREDKRGSIPNHLSPILDRLNISNKDWLNNAMSFEANYQKKYARKRRKKELAA